MSALGGLLGLTFGAGLVLLIAGVRGRPVDELRSRRRLRLGEQSIARLMAQALVGTVAFAVTGWPVAGLAGAVGAALVPRWLRSSKNTDQLTLVQALEAWIETLRDILHAGGLGLQTAVCATAPDAPAAIRADVQRLAEDCRAGSFDDALDAFAAGVAHPACDQVVVGLHLHGAERLGDMLTSVAAALHSEADLHRRVDAQRHPERLTAVWIIYITLASLAVAALLAHSFLAPYASPTGQLGLAAIIAGMGFGLWWSSWAARDRPPRRVLVPRRVPH